MVIKLGKIGGWGSLLVMMLGNIFRVYSGVPNMIIYLNIYCVQCPRQHPIKELLCSWWKNGQKSRKTPENNNNNSVLDVRQLPSEFASEPIYNWKFVITSGWLCRILPNFSYCSCDTITFKSHICLICWCVTKPLVKNISDWKHYTLK